MKKPASCGIRLEGGLKEVNCSKRSKGQEPVYRPVFRRARWGLVIALLILVVLTDPRLKPSTFPRLLSSTSANQSGSSGASEVSPPLVVGKWVEAEISLGQ